MPPTRKRVKRPVRSRRANPLTTFIKRAYANAPGVRRLFDDAGIAPIEIETPSDLERVPVVTKDRLSEFQKQWVPFGGFLAVPRDRVKRIFLSPGPLYEPQSDDDELDKTVAKIFRIGGFKKGDVVLNTLSYHLVPAGLLLDGGLQRVGATVVPSGIGNTELQVKIMLDLRITGFVGTPSFLITLLKKAEELGINPRTQFYLTRALLTAEPYPATLRDQFHNHYHLHTINAYGTAELGLLAYDCDAQQGLHFIDGPIIQICDPVTGKHVASGESGQVVVTTFNETYPTIRLGTGDLATYNAAPCACGRTEPRLTLVGRVGEAVKVRGMFVHPNQLKLVAAKFPSIARVQAVITRPEHRDEFSLKVELLHEVPDRTALEQELTETTRNICRVGLDRIEFVPTGGIPPDAKGIADERVWE